MHSAKKGGSTPVSCQPILVLHIPPFPPFPLPPPPPMRTTPHSPTAYLAMSHPLRRGESLEVVVKSFCPGLMLSLLWALNLTLRPFFPTSQSHIDGLHTHTLAFAPAPLTKRVDMNSLATNPILTLG